MTWYSLCAERFEAPVQTTNIFHLRFFCILGHSRKNQSNTFIVFLLLLNVKMGLI